MMLQKYSDGLGNELELSVDIESKNDLVHQVKFKGNLCEKFRDEIHFLESELVEVPLTSIAVILDRRPSLPTLPRMLLVYFFRDYLGILVKKENHQQICACFGLNQNELENLINGKEALTSFAEVTVKTKASLGCGSCLLRLQNEYCRALCLKKDWTRKNNHKSDSSFQEMWPTFKNLTFGQTLILADDLKKEWLKKEERMENEIIFTSSNHSSFGIEIYYRSCREQDGGETALSLTQYLFSRSGLLIFFHREL